MTDTIYVSLGETHEKWTLSECDFRISFWHNMISLFTTLILNRYVYISIYIYSLEREREREIQYFPSSSLQISPLPPKKINHFLPQQNPKSQQKLESYPTHIISLSFTYCIPSIPFILVMTFPSSPWKCQSLWVSPANFHERRSGWWFQPIWKILVKLGIFSK